MGRGQNRTRDTLSVKHNVKTFFPFVLWRGSRLLGAMRNPFDASPAPATAAAAVFDPFAPMQPVPAHASASTSALQQQQQQQQQLVLSVAPQQEASDEASLEQTDRSSCEGSAQSTGPEQLFTASRSRDAKTTTSHKFKLTIPRYVVNGGFSWKFDADAYGKDLGDLGLSAEEYTATVERLNSELKAARPTSLDAALFFAIPMMLPAVPWALRRKRQTKLRKHLLASAIRRFNDAHPALLMHYYSASRGGGGSSALTIERRDAVAHVTS